ncbi:unnamed protein product [Rotaria magnacalcarata]|uniref:Tetrapyrrole biosynthesis uroporphyrinogen III synthase domain-containing protein n=3 Tax=Rotaria magnacalcarata TaxID=392030 RepID=A0A814YPC8_9BILA|nr:unnamed protein product [Rotaria magnacalcarata]CAF1398205.1 unnamed protein product [Rotaria magnacalcarata]CAF2130079.1 unnamed protein product [Rotaria magnacalcarata]CAF3833319.1 unnamed protein product [Rotaria magnacalcarata]
MSVKTILLFRSKPDDASSDDVYEKLLNDHGYHVKTISPIQFRFINMDLLSTKLHSNHYHGLIFTSKRAVEAVQRVLTGNDRQRLQRIYVEGPATGALVQEIFGSTAKILGAESGGSECLAEFIIKDVESTEGTVSLLFPCAQARLDILPRRLSSEQAIYLDEILVYETTPSDSLEHDLNEYLKDHGRPNAVGFFSPSGFDSVFKASQRIDFDLTNNKTVLISLGKTTSAAIRNCLDSSSFDERSCLKPTADEFLRVVQSIE